MNGRVVWWVEKLDNSRYAFMAIILLGGFFLLGDSVAIMRSAQIAVPEAGVVPGQVAPRSVPTFELVTWWDYGRTAITLFAVAALAVMMLRSRAVSIFKEEVEAQRVRVERMQREHDDAVRDAAAKDAELVQLRGRTDLTRVIEMQQELLLMKREHDTSMVSAIAKVSDRADTNYSAAMETLTKTLNYLADTARLNQEATKTNRELLDRVIKLAESNWHATSRIEQAVVTRDDTRDDERRDKRRE